MTPPPTRRSGLGAPASCAPDRRWHATATIIGAAAVAVAALALVTDGVHFPSDVIASVVWTLAVAPAVRYLWVDLVMPRVPLLGTG